MHHLRGDKNGMLTVVVKRQTEEIKCQERALQITVEPQDLVLF